MGEPRCHRPVLPVVLHSMNYLVLQTPEGRFCSQLQVELPGTRKILIGPQAENKDLKIKPLPPFFPQLPLKEAGSSVPTGLPLDGDAAPHLWIRVSLSFPVLGEGHDGSGSRTPEAPCSAS